MEHTYTYAHLAIKNQFIYLYIFFEYTEKVYGLHSNSCVYVCWFLSCSEARSIVFMLSMNVRQICTHKLKRNFVTSFSSSLSCSLACFGLAFTKYDTKHIRAQLEDKVTNGMVTLPLHSLTHLHPTQTRKHTHTVTLTPCLLSWFNFHLSIDRHKQTMTLRFVCVLV